MQSAYEPELWAQMADEARAAAKEVEDPDLKLHVLLVAARYLAWAKKTAKEGNPIHRRERPDQRRIE